MEPKKYEYIDSLRGIAVLTVMIVHIAFIGEISKIFDFLPDTILAFINNGQHGVQLFFVVSAFTLMLSHQNRQSEPHATRNFFIRRLCRITPMYYLAILFFTFVFLGIASGNLYWESIHKKALISSLLYLNGFLPDSINNYVPGGWTISVEFTFYAMLPFLCKVIKNINQAISFVLISLLFGTGLNLLLAGTMFDTNNFLGLYIFNQLPTFALGILAYFIVTEKSIKIKPITLLYITVTIYIFCYVSASIYFLISLVYFFLLLVLCYKPYKLFSNKFFAFVGKRSFSMYLVHFMVIEIFNMTGFGYLFKINNTITAYTSYLLGYIALFIASLIISMATYKFIELPGQNLGRKLIKKLNQQKG